MAVKKSVLVSNDRYNKHTRKKFTLLEKVQLAAIAEPVCPKVRYSRDTKNAKPHLGRLENPKCNLDSSQQQTEARNVEQTYSTTVFIQFFDHVIVVLFAISFYLGFMLRFPELVHTRGKIETRRRTSLSKM